MNREKQVGNLKKDGSMDFRALNLVQTVTKDSLVATGYPPTRGIPGLTLTGRELPAEAGAEFRVEAKDNIRVEKENDLVRYYAECEGLVLFRGNKISVDPPQDHNIAVPGALTRLTHSPALSLFTRSMNRFTRSPSTRLFQLPSILK